MDNNIIVLSLIALTILASGCTDTSEEGQESQASVEIHSLEVEPEEIFEGNPIRARLELENSGNIPGSIDVGRKGTNVLKDYCPDVFELEEDDGFQVTPQTNREGDTKYDLPSGAGLTLQWNLEQEGDVPLYGKQCTMEFEVPFNYSVSAYRQIQVKQDRSVEGSELNWESSSGPLLMAIEPIGGSGEEGQGTFIQNSDSQDGYVDNSMDIQIQLRNTEEEGYNKGVVDINQESFQVSFELNGHDFTETMSTSEKCEFDEDRPIRMFEGQSRVITCEVDLENVPELTNQLSVVGEIRTQLEYTYLKEAGTREVEVKYSG